MTSAHSILKALTARDGSLAHAREPALILGAYLVYVLTRNLLGGGSDGAAVDNAAKLIAFESARGFFWEPSWHQWAVDAGQWLVVLFNWVYILTFFPIVLATALIYYIRDRDRYFYYRNIILISFAVALAVFTIYPLAPPRMMPDFGFVDTFKEFGPSWYAGREMAVYYNSFAAMPSLHFAWTVIFGVLFFRQGGIALKALGVLYPTMTFFAIIITANHYVLDAVAGAAMMALTYLGYELVVVRRPIPKPGFAAMWARLRLLPPAAKARGHRRLDAPRSEASP